MNRTIASAIEGMHLLYLQYDGYSRTVEPHAYGVDKNEDGKLRCFQIAGGSLSNEPVGWKILNVNEIRMMNTTGTTFSSARPGYKRGDKAMERIYAQL